MTHMGNLKVRDHEMARTFSLFPRKATRLDIEQYPESMRQLSVAPLHLPPAAELAERMRIS